ncbi:MAG: hypothetical protein DI566_08550 [Microbacterium sp.]|nr:MAG: hypothetical protein DI566_08550 [Microbacterium sp.]
MYILVAVYAAAAALVVWAIVLRRQAGRLPRSLVAEYAPCPRARVLDDAVLAEQDRRAAAAGGSAVDRPHRRGPSLHGRR